MIRESATRARIDRRRRARLAAVAAVAVVAFVAASCGDSGEAADPADDTSTTVAEVGGDDTTTASTVAEATSTTSTTTAPPTLEERIMANMQGTQREYLDEWAEFGAPDLGLVFFHRGDWASEALQSHSTGEWCERGTYSWSVADATSESNFTIHYDALNEDPDCLDLGVDRLTAVFSGSQVVDGGTVYDFTYTEGTPFSPSTGTRTVCSDQWDDPEPCGLTLAGFEMSTPPEG